MSIYLEGPPDQGIVLKGYIQFPPVPFTVTLTPPAPPPLFLDNFVDADGTLLQNHTPDVGNPWNKAGNDAQILSNKLAGVVANIDPLYVADVGITTGTVSANLALDTTDTQVNLYLGTNISGASNVGYIIICMPLTNSVQIYSGGILASGSNTFVAGAQVWKTVLDASNISFYINDILVLATGASAASVSTFYGLEMFHPAALPGTTWSKYSVSQP